MRDRKEIESEFLLDGEVRGASFFNQALMLEVLLDIREAVSPPVITHHIETPEEKEERCNPNKP